MGKFRLSFFILIFFVAGLSIFLLQPSQALASCPAGAAGSFTVTWGCSSNCGGYDAIKPNDSGTFGTGETIVPLDSLQKMECSIFNSIYQWGPSSWDNGWSWAYTGGVDERWYSEFVGALYWTTATTIAGEWHTIDTGSWSVTFPITLTKAGTGSGTVVSSPAGFNCGPTCSNEQHVALFAVLIPYVFTATPASGSTFVGWSGCDSTTGTLPNQTCSVWANSPKNITAAFTSTGKYKCSGSSCVQDDINGTYTTSNCDNACPGGTPAKYRCSGTSCIRDDTNGTYTASNCNGACAATNYSCNAGTGTCYADASGGYTSSSQCQSSCYIPTYWATLTLHVKQKTAAWPCRWNAYGYWDRCDWTNWQNADYGQAPWQVDFLARW